MDLDDKSIVQEEIKFAGTKTTTALFKDISADDEDQVPTEIESLCMNCGKQGVTRLLLTRIPFFREVIVGSFSCDHCGYTDSEINSAGRIQDKGVRIALQVSEKADLNRQIVKSDTAAIRIPHVELEIPPKKGCFTTIEGVIDTTCEELEFHQPVRQIQDPETADKIEKFVVRLRDLKLVKEPFQVIVEDPTGNSHVENPKAPSLDPLLHTIYFNRNTAQNEALGIADTTPTVHLSQTPQAGEPGVEGVSVSEEVLQFQSNCTVCNAPCETNMKMVNIPRFKQVIIMAMVCDVCGFRDNEVKSGTGIADKGVKLTLHVRETVDLSRDVLKSDTASCSVPELDLHLEYGTLGGKFTTVEGLLAAVRDQLKNTNFTFTGGDSSKAEDKTAMGKLLDNLNSVITGERLDVHVIVDDAAGNSYIQDIYEPAPDPCLTIEHYVRNEEQNEELGLIGMNTASTDQVPLNGEKQKS